MVLTLQRRFLIFHLLPLTLILVTTGVALFLYARSYLHDQWRSTAKLRLEKASHQIEMRLDKKRQLINLIVDAEAIPEAAIVQAYLAQQLARQEGVRFVDIRAVRPASQGRDKQARAIPAANHWTTSGFVRLAGHQGTTMNHGGNGRMDLRQEGGHRRPETIPAYSSIEVSIDKLRNFLTLKRRFGGVGGQPEKIIDVRMGFDSFLKKVLEIGHWRGSYALLVKSDGSYLAQTGSAVRREEKLGASGDPLEIRVLQEMSGKSFGTVFGEGHPPDRVIGFARVPTTDWYLVLVSPGSVLMAPIVRFRFNYTLLGIVSLICIGLLIRSTTGPVIRAIEEICDAAEQVEKGDYTMQVPGERTDEIGQLVRRFNKMVSGLKQRDLVERTFGRYVDRRVMTDLLQKPEALELGGRNETVTIMMADLRGFTRMSEGMKPQQVVTILNRYFSRMIEVVEEHKGIIVDFYGDGLLVFFDGTDENLGGRALDAVKCALAMQKELDSVSRQNLTEGLPELHMGIGIHTGEVVVGNIGSETRAKYGIVGSPVNETDRIQSFAEGGAVLISEKTRQRVEYRVSTTPRGEVHLKGLTAVRKLYEVGAVTA